MQGEGIYGGMKVTASWEALDSGMIYKILEKYIKDDIIFRLNKNSVYFYTG